MNRIAYTAFVAFLSSVLTLLSVHALSSDGGRSEMRVETPGDGLREIGLDELAEHDHAGSCWKAIHGRVYDVTDYVPDHPTPEEVILEWCGRESSEAWDNKRPGRPHSPAAGAMLEPYLIGTLADVAAAGDGRGARDADSGATAPARQRAGDDARLARALLGLAPGTYLDGRYRGIFADRGEMQVNVQFELRDGRLHDLRYRQLAYRGVDYLTLEEGDALHPLLIQHLWIGEGLEGRPLPAIFELYEPQVLIDDLDGFSGATLPGNKVLSAIRDGLNRGVYQWP